jgi:hypothetical protein
MENETVLFKDCLQHTPNNRLCGALIILESNGDEQWGRP